MGGRLASSWISKPFSARVAPEKVVEKPLPRKIEALKHRGWRGGLITPHRAFAYLKIGAKEIITSLLMVIGFTYAWIRIVPSVGRWWGRIFAYWTKALNLEGTVIMAPEQWGHHIRFSVPYISGAAGPADPHTWWITGVVTLGVFALTYFMSEEQTAWMYLLRFLIILQGTALVYFVFAAARFPHDLPSYTEGMLYFGTILVGLVPLILGFTFYLFDFTLTKKLALTLACMSYLTVFMPMQYMLHVYILQKSILYMPLLYFAFGPFLDVLVFVALYSWGMSWKSRNQLIS
jgi:hypothetical protein